ncbi:hypothetical protein J6590_042426 [Homalodisca vitripennis]|nr:hypothetical protein J6590_042426 [Homalodisca vitripennis]
MWGMCYRSWEPTGLLLERLEQIVLHNNIIGACGVVALLNKSDPSSRPRRTDHLSLLLVFGFHRLSCSRLIYNFIVNNDPRLGYSPLTKEESFLLAEYIGSIGDWRRCIQLNSCRHRFLLEYGNRLS